MTDSSDDKDRKPYQQPVILSRSHTGRPSKYTPERHVTICHYIAQGNTRDIAARKGGIAPDTLYDWMQRFPQFSEDVKEADNEYEIYAIEQIRLAMPEHWQAAAWMLERRKPDKYGRRLRVDRESDTEPRRFVPREDGGFDLVYGHNEMLNDKPEPNEPPADE